MKIINQGALKHKANIMRQKKNEIDSTTIIIGDFSIPFINEEIIQKKVNKEILGLNNIYQMN